MTRRSVLLVSLVILLFWIAVSSASAGLIGLGLEKQIGASGAEQLEKQYGVVNSPAANQLQNIANKLARVIGRPEISYQVKILNNNDVNAVSLPGGYIYVNQGMVKHSTNITELASIIGHEMSHISLKHCTKQFDSGIVVAAASLLLGKKASSSDIFKLGTQAIMAHHSRADEKEADLNSVRGLVAVGIDPAGSLTAMRRIETLHKQQPNLVEAIFASHPPPQDRSEYLKDYILRSRFGTDFKHVKRKLWLSQSRNARTGDAPVIIAHPSIWEQGNPELLGNYCAVGIFNPAPKTKEDQDVEFYLNCLRQGYSIGVTADNDSHGILTPFATATSRFTFVQVPNLSLENMYAGIKNRRTYASADGTELTDMSFAIGNDYPKVDQSRLSFRLKLAQKMSAPPVIIYRDGEKVAEIKSKSKGRNLTEASYDWSDKDKEIGDHWYVIYIPKILITSPITYRIDPEIKTELTGRNELWAKGIVHYHSVYSDGTALLGSMYQEFPQSGVTFACITDHADCFGTDVGWHRERFDVVDEIIGMVHEHGHQANNPYSKLVEGCRYYNSLGSPVPQLSPGIEFPLTDYKLKRHILVLGLDNNIPYQPASEREFFQTGVGRNKIDLERGPFYLGDDRPNSDTLYPNMFALRPEDLYGRTNVIARMQVKAIPRKDPVVSINRQVVGRAIATKDSWETFEFSFSPQLLHPGNNLIDLETIIPDLRDTFDDCEIQWLHLLLQ